MAREESEREDLLGEATALVERIELVPRLSNATEAIVVGFRAGGALSMFFGEDPAYHFNAASELRRAYCGGLLFKAVNARLVSLRRERTADETQLVRHDLTAAEQSEFLAAMSDQFRELLMLLKTCDYDVRGQIPPDVDLVGRVVTWLDQHREPRIAQRPNV